MAEGWELSRLVAWAFFDQQKKTEVDGDESKKTTEADRKKRNPTKRPFKPNYAYKAGQLYLLCHLPRLSRHNGTPSRFRDLTTDEALLAFSMFLETGEKKRSFGLGGRTLSKLHSDNNKHQELRVVYHVMDFLVRATLARRDDLCKVVRARHFVEKVDHLSGSTVDKTWDRYRTAAPYIHALYPRIYPTASREGAHSDEAIETDVDWIRCIAQLTKKSALEECFGQAAYAADVLAKTGTRDVRIQDFENVPRVMPLLPAFDADEEKIIQSYYEAKHGPLKGNKKQ